MKLGSLREGGRDGTLVVVSRDLRRAVKVPDIAATFQRALDDWKICADRLQAVSNALNDGKSSGSFELDVDAMHSPLPRAYQWCEGSAYLSHMERCRRANGRDLPAILYSDPAMYQGGSDSFVGPRDPMWVVDDNWDVDLEGGICVITDDVPIGTTAEEAKSHIKLLILTNDFSLRAVQIPEMSKGCGPFIGKPANAFSPVAVSLDEVGNYWTGGLLARQLVVTVNGKLLGDPWGDRDALYDIPTLIAHLAQTRNIVAGSIIGAGTVSNRDDSTGAACVYEKRSMEKLATGAPITPWLKFGDTIRIECFDELGASIFGAIEQKVTKYEKTQASVARP